MNFEWDIFLSHASEDRRFVEKFFFTLNSNGVKVWYDPVILKIDDSIRRAIDNGLAHSRYGIVLISINFIKKEWTKKELDVLFNREDDCILPIWHKVSENDVRKFSLMLLDKYTLKSDMPYVKAFLAENINYRTQKSINDRIDAAYSRL